MTQTHRPLIFQKVVTPEFKATIPGSQLREHPGITQHQTFETTEETRLYFERIQKLAEELNRNMADRSKLPPLHVLRVEGMGCYYVLGDSGLWKAYQNLRSDPPAMIFHVSRCDLPHIASALEGGE